MHFYSFLLLPLSPPSQFLWNLFSGLGHCPCLCLLSLPSGDAHFPSGNEWFSTHLLWSLNICCELEQGDQSCLHKHIQWFCPLSRRFVFHCLGWSWFLPQHVLWWQLSSLFPLWRHWLFCAVLYPVVWGILKVCRISILGERHNVPAGLTVALTHNVGGFFWWFFFNTSLTRVL